MWVSIGRTLILLSSLQAASPTADEQAIEASLNSKSFDAINAMLANNDGNGKIAEYIDTLTLQVVNHLTPFITEFLSIQGKVDQNELKKNLFNIAYVQSLLTQLSSCKKNGLMILKRLSVELPKLCKDQDTKQVLSDASIFVNFHGVISDPRNRIESIDTIASSPIDESVMKKLALAFMQDFHKIVTSNTSIISHQDNQKLVLENDIASLKRSITILSWILGGFIVLIVAELVLLFLRRERLRK